MTAAAAPAPRPTAMSEEDRQIAVLEAAETILSLYRDAPYSAQVNFVNATTHLMRCPPRPAEHRTVETEAEASKKTFSGMTFRIAGGLVGWISGGVASVTEIIQASRPSVP